MHLLRKYTEEEEAVFEAMAMASKLKDDRLGMIGYGIAHLIDGDGKTKLLVPFANRITTAGDEYYVRRGAAGIGTPNIAQPTLVNGMKLGTGATAASKSGAGAALGATYIAASNNLFDTTHPTVAAVGGDTGWNIVYKNTWAPGDVTETALTEVVIVNDAAVDATSSAANTIARAILSPTVNKTAADQLAVTWTHTFLGA